MKIAITGANGQLATQIITDLKRGHSEISAIPNELLNAEIVMLDLPDFDITNEKSTVERIAEINPDIIINCAAATNVNGCESDRDGAFLVNATGARNIAIAAEGRGAKLVHISTDYVLSGKDNKEYVETDKADPGQVYGESKLAGEQEVLQNCKKSFILRVSWLYGYAGNNFVKTIVKASRQRELSVVNDQFGNPTNAADLSHHILKIVSTEKYGLYHCAGKGIASWYDFACLIVELSKTGGSVKPCTSAEYPSPCYRPLYSPLDCTKYDNAVGYEFRDWQVALKAFFDTMPGDMIV